MDDLTLQNIVINQKKKEKRSKIIIAIVVVFVFFIVILVASTGESKTKDKSETESNKTTTVKSYPKIGEILKTEYFDVTVNKIAVTDFINFHNEFMNVKAGNGNKFLLLNVTVKNTDTESRMMFSDGIIWMNYNGKEYKFETSETILAEGWGFIMDDINPLVSKTTNIAYKIPSDIKGEAYFQSGRSNDDERIFLGTIQ